MAKNTWLSQGWEIDVPAGIYLLKVDNRSTRTRCQNMFKVSNKGTITLPDVVMVSLLLTLDIFHTLY